MSDGFDLAQTFVHLGLGSTATPLPDFTLSPEYLDAYEARFASDGAEGRLVCVTPQDATWDAWERHPAGEEVVFLISGRVDLVQEIDGAERVVELRPGQAMVNPAERLAHGPGARAGAGAVHHPRRRDGGPAAWPESAATRRAQPFGASSCGPCAGYPPASRMA